MSGRRLSHRVVVALAALALSAAGAGRPTSAAGPFVEAAQLRPSNGGSDDFFGRSVAGSGRTLAVSSVALDTVYLFDRPAGGWTSGTETARLTPSDGGLPAHFFGIALAFEGDTVAVGALRSSSSKGGAVYLFETPAAGWTDATEVARLTPSDGFKNDAFGFAVSISGNTVAVGARAQDGEAGAVYVFEKPAGGWVDMTETARLTASDPETFAHLGVSVAIDDDTVAAGAPGSSAVYVFERPAAGWLSATETAKLTALERPEGDRRLGRSVSLSGGTLVAGAATDFERGSAYVFEAPGGGWVSGTEAARLTASDPFQSDFGSAVSARGDLVVIGAPLERAIRKVAYLFERPAGGWVSGTETAQLLPSDGNASRHFGAALAVTDTAVVVGGLRSEGAAYVYEVVDLALAVSDSVDPVVAGSGPGNLTYAVTVTNHGPSPASDLILDTALDLPAGVAVGSITAGGSSTYMPADPASGSWSIAALAAGATETLTVVLTADAAAVDGTVASLAAEVRSVDQGGVGDTAAAESTTVSSAVREVSLRLTTEESVDPVLAFGDPEPLVYTVAVANEGPSAASGLQLSESLTLPPGVAVAAIHPQPGTAYTPTDGTHGIWTVGELPAEAVKTLKVELTVDPSAAPGLDTIGNSVAVAALDQPNHGDTTVTESTSVNQQVSLALAGAASADPVTAGSGAGNLTTVLTVTNSGPFAVTGLVLETPPAVPAGVVVESRTPSGGTTLEDDRWTVGTLTVGASETLTVVYTVGAAAAGGFDAVVTEATVAALDQLNTGDAAVRVAASIDVPFAPLPPLGSLVYEKRIGGGVLAAGEERLWPLELDAGQTLSVATDPDGALRPALELTGPAGGAVATAIAGAAGEAAHLRTAPVAAAGTYTLRIAGAGGTAGRFSLRVVLNAALEEEEHGGPPNDTGAAAQDLGPAVPVLGGSPRSAVVGAGRVAATLAADDFESGSLGSDWTCSAAAGGLCGVFDFSPAVAAADGRRALWMLPAGGGTATLAEAVWTVDLSGATSAALHFSHLEMLDEETPFAGPFTGSFPADGIAISTDGDVWYPVFTPPDQGSEVWVRHTVDLAAAAAAAGLELGPGFRIKFQQVGDGSFPEDGRAWDGISIVAREADLYRFTLAAGERVTLLSAGVTGAADFEVRDAGGATLVRASAGPGSDGRTVLDFEAPAPGSYLVRVESDRRYTLALLPQATFEADADESLEAAQVLGPGGVAVGHLGRSLVTLSSVTGEIKRVEAATGGVVAHFRVPEVRAFGGSGLAATGRTLLAVAGSGPIVELDPGTGDVLRTLADPGGFLAGLALHAGELFAFDLDSPDPLTVLDPASGAVRRRLRPSPRLRGLTGASRGLFGVAGSPGDPVSLHAIDPLSGTATPVHQLDLGSGGSVSGLGVIDDEVFVAGPSALEVFDLATGAPLRRFEGFSGLVALGADGEGIAETDVYRLDAAAGETLRLATATPGDGPYEPANGLDLRIELYDPAGALVARDDDGAPDGRNAELVHLAEVGGTYRVRLLAAAGHGAYELVGSASFDDGDGIPAAVENAGPNDGDGDGNGIPDSTEATAASLPAAGGTGYLTVTSPPGCPLRGVTAVDPGTLPPDPAYAPAHGLVAFEIDCPAATVEVLYHGSAAPGEWVYRSHVPTPADPAPRWHTLPASFGTTAVNGVAVARARLDLADGAFGDDALAPDGRIVTRGGAAGPREAPISEIPTLSEWMLLLFALAVALAAVAALGRPP